MISVQWCSGVHSLGVSEYIFLDEGGNFVIVHSCPKDKLSGALGAGQSLFGFG